MGALRAGVATDLEAGTSNQNELLEGFEETLSELEARLGPLEAEAAGRRGADKEVAAHMEAVQARLEELDAQAQQGTSAAGALAPELAARVEGLAQGMAAVSGRLGGVEGELGELRQAQQQAGAMAESALQVATAQVGQLNERLGRDVAALEAAAEGRVKEAEARAHAATRQLEELVMRAGALEAEVQGLKASEQAAGGAERASVSGSRATLEAVAALPGAVTVMKGQLEEHQAALAELRSKMESVSAAAAVPPAEKAPSAAAEPEELRRLQAATGEQAAALARQGERLGALEAKAITADSVGQTLRDFADSEQLVNRAQAEAVVDLLRQDILMELEAGKEVQNDLLEGVEGGLGELEERLKVAEEAAAALESSLRGTITEEVEGQLAEWRAEVFQEMKAQIEDRVGGGN
mmetsp:Transcript_881/g.2185  ORF Transcript_881/g.2185 Transcript_881/m.2185 type:complete len:410 (-) Transcript_881:376-1605(-)